MEDAATVGAAVAPDGLAGADDGGGGGGELDVVAGDGVVDGAGSGVLDGSGGVVAGGAAVVGGVGAAALSFWAHGCHSSAAPAMSASITAVASIPRTGDRLRVEAAGRIAGMGACWVGADAR